MSEGLLRRFIRDYRKDVDKPQPQFQLLGWTFETLDEDDAGVIKTVLEECPDLRSAFDTLCDQLAALREVV